MIKLDRRTVLHGMLGGATASVGLPMLDIMVNSHGTAQADGSNFPQRFGLFFWGNGNLPDRWVPKIEGKEYKLTEQLAPLARHKDVISVVSGLRVLIPNRLPHNSGAAGMLSASIGVGADNSFSFINPSIDQVIAQNAGSATRFKSIEYGTVKSRYSSSGPNSFNIPINEPADLYSRLFLNGFNLQSEGVGPDPSLAMRRSVLDAVLAQSKTLQRKLGKRDRDRLDQHFNGIRELEQRILLIERNPPNFDSCARPDDPGAELGQVINRAQLEVRNVAMNKIMALGLACDQTRVFSNWLTGAVDNSLLFDGASKGHHQLTHDEPGDQPMVHNIVVQIIDQFALMLDELRAIPEGDGTLLDNSIVMGSSEISEGRLHSLDEMPVVLAGSAGGQIKLGEHMRFPDFNVTKLLITLQQVMGISVTEYGVGAAQATGGLDGLRV